VRDDIETLVLDAQVLEEILSDIEPGKRAKQVEIKLVARLRKHLGNPKFTALGERLEKIKERHEQGFLTSLEFLKQILEIAKEVVEAEKQTDPEEDRNRAKEALTELFKEAKNTNTHIHRGTYRRGHRRHREEDTLPRLAAHNARANDLCKTNSAKRCSNINCIVTTNCSIRRINISGSITDPLLAVRRGR
jgi:hypothetical protein